MQQMNNLVFVVDVCVVQDGFYAATGISCEIWNIGAK